MKPSLFLRKISKSLSYKIRRTSKNLNTNLPNPNKHSFNILNGLSFSNSEYLRVSLNQTLITITIL